VRRLLEKLFIWLGMVEEVALIFSWFLAVGIVAFVMVRIGIGMSDANDKDKCVVHSIGDIMLSPAYAIGCNISKERFNIHLN
jgi:hypothetical protein